MSCSCHVHVMFMFVPVHARTDCPLSLRRMSMPGINSVAIKPVQKGRKSTRDTHGGKAAPSYPGSRAVAMAASQTRDKELGAGAYALSARDLHAAVGRDGLA
eukprot:2279561-Prymnesium_polylepis.1